MAAKVTRKDIAEYKAFAKQEGRDISHLTDDQIVAQIRIQKGGMAPPSTSDIDDILARAKATEKVFEQCRKDVLATLKMALADFQKLDQEPAAKPLNRMFSSMAKRAQRVVALKKELLAYPPSMLSPELQKVLAHVDSWGVHAEKLLKGKNAQSEEALLGMSGRLAKALKGI